MKEVTIALQLTASYQGTSGERLFSLTHQSVAPIIKELKCRLRGESMLACTNSIYNHWLSFCLIRGEGQDFQYYHESYLSVFAASVILP